MAGDASPFCQALKILDYFYFQSGVFQMLDDTWIRSGVCDDQINPF